MKKQLIKISLFVLAISGIFAGCKSDSDTSAPVITLNGRNPDSLEMLDTYVDLGATAFDDEDGILTSSILRDESAIKKNIIATYKVYYSVSDAAGNVADADRSVVVYASPDALAKPYTVIDSCGTAPALIIFNYTQQPTAFSATQIKFNKFANLSGNINIVATINRNGAITLPLQTANGVGSLAENHEFQGTGYVTATGFYLEYTDHNLSNSSSAVCKAYFTR